MERWDRPGGGALALERGDLVRVEADAIVNAANPTLLGGGGVDGAVHRAAGPDLIAACRRIPSVGGVRCPTGEARLTPGCDLPARFVIHTVGPIYSRDPDPAGHLAQAHRSSLQLARDHELRTIAFPAISCGIYGYPAAEAAEIAIRAAVEHGHDLGEVRFVLYSEALYDAWRAAAVARLGEPS
jgi:O-acetyl-ADP-ribose deacetylase (regulator of RNase III)